MNSGVNAFGQGNRANSTIGRALQLVDPQRRRRAARATRTGPPTASPGKFGFASPRTRTVAVARRLARRGSAADETGVTLFAGEAPRLVLDQLAREPESLAVRSAAGARARRAPSGARLATPCSWSAPEHGRVFREAGWRATARPGAHRRCHAPAGSSSAASAGSPRARPNGSTIATAVPKFRARRILLAYAGGEAGLFSMVIGGWVTGEAGVSP